MIRETVKFVVFTYVRDILFPIIVSVTLYMGIAI